MHCAYLWRPVALLPDWRAKGVVCCHLDLAENEREWQIEAVGNKDSNRIRFFRATLHSSIQVNSYNTTVQRIYACIRHLYTWNHLHPLESLNMPRYRSTAPLEGTQYDGMHPNPISLGNQFNGSKKFSDFLNVGWSWCRSFMIFYLRLAFLRPFTQNEAKTSSPTACLKSLKLGYKSRWPGGSKSMEQKAFSGSQNPDVLLEYNWSYYWPN